MMIKKNNQATYLGLLLAVTMFGTTVIGCASGPQTIASLERARAVYAEASANPDIVANAQVPMHDAKLALDRAGAAKEVKDAEHLAYLAERQVQTAVAIAERKMAEAEVERLRQERSRIIIEHRGQEAKQARMKAEARGREAEQARKLAEVKTRLAEEKTRQLELSQQEAEARALEAEEARQKAAQLEAEIAELQAKQTDRGIVLTLGDVLFAYDKAELQPGAMRTIDKLVEFLQKHTDRTLVIEGHTDSRGSDDYNLDLSQRRADAVGNALIARGVDPVRIQARGMGELYPVAGNDTDAGRQQNRRVEIIISESSEDVQ